MTRCFQENDYLICPHTAVAVCYHYDRPVTAGLNRLRFILNSWCHWWSFILFIWMNSSFRCCIATASPAKFQEAVHRAGLTLDLPEALLALETLETRYEVLEKSEDWESKLRQHIELIASVRRRGQMFYTSEAKEWMSNVFIKNISLRHQLHFDFSYVCSTDVLCVGSALAIKLNRINFRGFYACFFSWGQNSELLHFTWMMMYVIQRRTRVTHIKRVSCVWFMFGCGP